MASTLKELDLNDPLTLKLTNLDLKFYKISSKTNAKPSIIWASPVYDQKITLPNQGFKIHISATIANCCQILECAADYLLNKHISFKVIASNYLLKKMNSDQLGYTQVGKFITIYPPAEDKAFEIAQDLSILLSGFKAPTIPFDLKFHPNSIVYIRYGRFVTSKNNSDKIILPNKKRVKDNRNIWAPEGIANNPFKSIADTIKNELKPKLLLDRFIIIKLITQRAKGSVSIALDLKLIPCSSKLIALKEARTDGNLEESGVDAVERLHWQETLSNRFSSYNICPKIEIPFIQTNTGGLLGFEYLKGQSLAKRILSKKPISFKSCINYMLSIAKIIKFLHEKNIYIFDLAPQNIFLSRTRIKIIDFEHAYGEGGPDFAGWELVTRGFAPSLAILRDETVDFYRRLVLRELFALGSIFLSLLCPRWYKDIIKFKTKTKNHYASAKYIQTLPQCFKHVLNKTLLFKDSYETVDAFINDLECIRLEKLYVTS